jgi:hypothetical protein
MTQKNIKFVEEEKVRWPAKKKYPCKRLKGNHQFIETKREQFVWNIGTPESVYIVRETIEFINYKCIGCGKRKCEMKTLSKKKIKGKKLNQSSIM